MRIYEITRFQWIAIAVVVGTLLAWLYGGSARVGHTQTHAPAVLEGLLARQPVKGSDDSVFPWTRNIVVYPPAQAGFAIEAAEGRVVPVRAAVTFEVLTAAPDRKGWIYRPGTSLMSVPYYARGNREFADPSAFFAAISADREWVQYRYAWWADPSYAYPIWIGGCVAVIGIMWPLVLGLLMGAGYGPSAEELAARKKERSGWLKSLFTRAPSSSSSSADDKRPTTVSFSDADLERIAQMEAELGDFAGHASGEAAPGKSAESGSEVRKLNAAPLEQAPTPQEQREQQEYDGEFYPTVAHAKKKS